MASLKDDHNATILPADKGEATIVLDREQRRSDGTTYSLIQCDPTAKKVALISKTISHLA